ncbi:hypothetical protein FHX05_005787 [Rhizobium sp. BK491]|nr:hypothetical protein [Rhizobium sp. BK491]
MATVEKEETAAREAVEHSLPFSEALKVWARMAALSFGGPAGQITVMHRIIVEEKRWIGEERFLHALFFGLKSAALAIVLGAVLRIGSRSLKNKVMIGLTAAAFVALSLFQSPFPLAACPPRFFRSRWHRGRYGRWHGAAHVSSPGFAPSIEGRCSPSEATCLHKGSASVRNH